MADSTRSEARSVAVLRTCWANSDTGRLEGSRPLSDRNRATGSSLGAAAPRLPEARSQAARVRRFRRAPPRTRELSSRERAHDRAPRRRGLPPGDVPEAVHEKRREPRRVPRVRRSKDDRIGPRGLFAAAPGARARRVPDLDGALVEGRHGLHGVVGDPEHQMAGAALVDPQGAVSAFRRRGRLVVVVVVVRQPGHGNAALLRREEPGKAPNRLSPDERRESVASSPSRVASDLARLPRP